MEAKEEPKIEQPAAKEGAANANTANGGGGTTSAPAAKKRSSDRARSRERSRRGDRSRGRPGGGSLYKPRTRPECRVYISNFPFDMRWQDLKDLFRTQGFFVVAILSRWIRFFADEMFVD